MANGSSSSLYGSIGYAVNDLIKSKFPLDYFKYTSVSSELAVRNMRRLFGGPNNSIEMQKRKKPWLIVQPIYSAVDRDGPMQNIPLTTNFDDLQYRADKTYLFQAIRDQRNGYNLKFKLNRDRIEFDITVMTSNLHSQLDIYRVMQNQMIWDRPFAYRIALESVIPKPMIAIMSKLCGMDIEQHEEYIPILLQRFNACSAYPITYKMRNASATDEWFLYYTHNVIVTFTDLTLENGNRKNMVEDEFPVTFRAIAEFNLPGVYFIDGNIDKAMKLEISIVSKAYSEENDAYVPIYTINNLYSRFPVEANGMQLYGTTIIKTEAKKGQLEEKVDITCVLDNDHIRAIRSHKAWKMNPNTLLKVYLLRDGELLKYDTDFYIDWNTLELCIKDPDNEATYRMVMYFNYQTVNEMLSNTAYLNNYDVDKLKENKFPDKGLEDEEVGIHSSNTNWGIYPDDIYTKEGATEEQKQDPDNVILEDDPTYDKGCVHPKVELEDTLWKNKVIINDPATGWKKPSDEMYMKGHVPPEEQGLPDTYVLKDDPTYCGGKPHEEVDIEGVVFKNKVVVHSSDTDWMAPSDELYMKGNVPEDEKLQPDTYVMHQDTDYKEEHGDEGISLSELTIAGISDSTKVNPPKVKPQEELNYDGLTNADIHNSDVVVPPKIKKKYSSSVEE